MALKIPNRRPHAWRIIPSVRSGSEVARRLFLTLQIPRINTSRLLLTSNREVYSCAFTHNIAATEPICLAKMPINSS